MTKWQWSVHMWSTNCNLNIFEFDRYSQKSHQIIISSCIIGSLLWSYYSLSCSCSCHFCHFSITFPIRCCYYRFGRILLLLLDIFSFFLLLYLLNGRMCLLGFHWKSLQMCHFSSACSHFKVQSGMMIIKSSICLIALCWWFRLAWAKGYNVLHVQCIYHFYCWMFLCVFRIFVFYLISFWLSFDIFGWPLSRLRIFFFYWQCVLLLFAAGRCL